MMKVLPEDVTPIDKLEDIAECRSFLKRIEEAEKNGFNPYFVPHEKPLRDVSIMNGKEVINFGSYNYLGMSGRTEIAAASKKAIDDYGTSASGSRILAGEKNLFIELEKEIADWKHTEAAMVLAAGNLTNTTFVGNFCGKNDAIFFDVLSHSSIEQGCKLSPAYAKRFSHNNYQSLERMLVHLRSKFQKVLIVIDGVYSIAGDIAPVPEFVRLKKKYGCFLMVDEAHSTGVIGPTGAGVDEYFCLMPDDIDIKMGTLSKALGSIGGYIASKNVLIN